MLSTPASGLWYGYYAGFSTDFARSALEAVKDFEGPVLDPWNGTGTTTHVAGSLGHKSIGFDINPALVVIAKARSVPKSRFNEVAETGLAIFDNSRSVISDTEPLAVWFSPESAGYVRSVTSKILELSGGRDQIDVESLSEEQCLLLVAVFKVVRSLMSALAGTNPTWWRRKILDGDRISLDREHLRTQLIGELDCLGVGLHDQSCVERPSLGVGDSRSISLADGEAGAVFTSPPYCTRIDYGVSTSPELAVLGYDATKLRSLRDKMVGTPTMTGEILDWDTLGPKGSNFLHLVSQHESYSSGVYYLKYFSQYYSAMRASLGEVRRVLAPGGACLLVVQDSYYKDLHNDVPSILSEICIGMELELTDRQDFPVVRNKRQINTRSRKYGSQKATESVLLFRRAR